MYSFDLVNVDSIIKITKEFIMGSDFEERRAGACTGFRF